MRRTTGSADKLLSAPSAAGRPLKEGAFLSTAANESECPRRSAYSAFTDDSHHGGTATQSDLPDMPGRSEPRHTPVGAGEPLSSRKPTATDNVSSSKDTGNTASDTPEDPMNDPHAPTESVDPAGSPEAGEKVKRGAAFLRGRKLRPGHIVILLAAVILLICFRRQAILALRLVLGAFLVAFLLDPLVCSMEKHMRRPAALALSVAIVLGALAALLTILLPPLVAQFRELIDIAPEIASRVNAQLSRWNQYLTERGLPSVSAQDIDWRSLAGNLGMIWSGTARWFGTMAEAVGQAGVAALLACYFLADKDGMLLRLEMWIPQSCRRTAARMTDAVRAEMLGYVRGQAIVSMLVATLAAFALWWIGVRGWLALGFVVGMANLIPYFGPLLGGIPAVLCALPDGTLPALLTTAALFLVQQIDGIFLTPRITGGSTGLRPPAVMLSVLVGGSAFGAAGMLLAVPALLAVRAVLRVWVGVTADR